MLSVIYSLIPGILRHAVVNDEDSLEIRLQNVQQVFLKPLQPSIFLFSPCLLFGPEIQVVILFHQILSFGSLTQCLHGSLELILLLDDLIDGVKLGVDLVDLVVDLVVDLASLGLQGRLLGLQGLFLDDAIVFFLPENEHLMNQRKTANLFTIFFYTGQVTPLSNLNYEYLQLPF